MGGEVSWARRGLDLLLREHPDADVAKVDGQEAAGDDDPEWFVRARGPWVSVTLVVDGEPRQFAVWKNTGCVYRVNEARAEDDPFLIPRGSPWWPDGGEPAPSEPRAMQVWRGKGDARGMEVRLVEVVGDDVIFERIAGPMNESMLRKPSRCTVGQLELAYEFAREATEDDLRGASDVRAVH